VTDHAAPVTLERRLGPIDAAAVVVSNVIGSGILILPAVIAMIAPAPWAMLGIWATGGLLAFAGAMAYAELAALRPRAGGEYVYLREAFGPLLAFLTGWTSFVAGFSGAIAASAVGFAGYLGRFVPIAGDTTPIVSLTLPYHLLSLSITPQAIIALALIAMLSIIHTLGLGPGRVVQNVLASFKLIALIVFVIAGLAWGAGSFDHFKAGADSHVTLSAWLLALIPVMFSYAGWNAASYIAEEIRDPSRNVPLALGMGTVAVVLVYLAMNVVYIYALPVDALTGLRVRVVDAAADVLFGHFIGNVVTIVTMVIVTGSISAMVFAGPRVYYAMARDGVFLASAARVHPSFRTPAVSILAQAVWSGLLVISGTFEQLTNYTGFAIMLFSAIAVTSLFVLRRRYPDEPRPFRAWGYPIAPGLFAIICYAACANAIWREPGPSAAGLGIIAIGIPIYLLFQRNQPNQTGSPSGVVSETGASSTISNQ
jgi:APA family basic amino acid/polyamine antiporter